MRGLSIRQACDAATANGYKVTNTTWSRWEAGTGKLTKGVRSAVAVAFGWANDWPENPPPPPTAPGQQDLEQQVANLVDMLTELTKQVAEQRVDLWDVQKDVQKLLPPTRRGRRATP